ncbi:MAG: acyltransferase [Hydrogenophaga sp.]|uniref:acyltransferase family protein n=1 Tax=Hydrogenophaga sp. TaxID=1904254 RepID=UPI001D404FA8|nr:acyltransferase [Hydrogenophaga sp.]MBX3610147.1 acyltransferase [Hydrogenophaga sp.]
MNAPLHRDAMLDRLRGLAALAVVFFHYLYKGPKEGWMHAERLGVLSDMAAYGYLGVHLFFMISGYVIMMTAQQAAVRQFVASRVARLVPAFWVCAALTVLVEWVIPSAPFHLQSASQWLANLTLVPSWFGQDAIDGAYWSLAVEINFYVWVAGIIALGQLRRAELILLAWLGVSMVNLVRPMYPVQLYLNAHWAPLFAAGALFFLVRQSGWTRRRAVSIALAFVLACGYAWREAGAVSEWGSLLRFTSRTNHLLVLALIAVFFGAFLKLVATRVPDGPTPTSDMMGRLTYPLYLVHQNIGYALFNAAVAAGWVASLGVGAVTLGLIVVSLLMAWLVNVFIEQPVGPWLRRLIGGKRDKHGRSSAREHMDNKPSAATGGST